MNEQELINFWKNNERPFGLCPKEAQEWLKQSQKRGVLPEIYSGDGWRSGAFAYCDELTYRLPADYQPKKAGRWVECEVLSEDGSYWFDCPGHPQKALCQAPGMVGFGGVKYEGYRHYTRLDYFPIGDEDKPVKPLAVRFWVEG